MDRIFYLDHAPIDFYFKHSPETFVVEEVPLYPFSGEGEHLILKVRKKGMTTWEMLQALSEQIGVKVKDIGYAGLKDKNALTYQYISINKKYEEPLERFFHTNIKIIETTRHKNKIRLGHLKGNRFFVRLKKVSPLSAKKIDEVLKIIAQEGLPNYFGYQRFGLDEKNYLIGQAIVEGKRKERSKKLRRFYINAYQSHLFNLWLSKRIEHSKLLKSFDPKELKDIFDLPTDLLKELKEQPRFFKIYPGDIMMHYPFGKIFFADDVPQEARRFLAKSVAPTGLLPGRRVKRSDGLSREIEKDFDDERIDEFGDRRYAWVFVEDLKGRYKEKEAWYELNFFLPKGSYATVLLEEIAHKKLKE
ncbi:MAG: tRNA pseudouridine(13) synthase TruD [Epsilonproteobacteria bacterium]|nr:tRNA pseudouridine(13) synthase TruD [Campylobacterota bacterium]NPA64781.1 tRNA pseudouridine(13) synthase TruD [Campylobacterota bacterium]